MVSVTNQWSRRLSAAAFMSFCYHVPTVSAWTTLCTLGYSLACQRGYQRYQGFRMVVSATEPPTHEHSAVYDCHTKTLSTVIVGGGPAGLATALMLARRGYHNITVVERLGEPPRPSSPEWGNPERSYNLGIGSRGQISLAHLGAAERVLSWCADAVVSSNSCFPGSIEPRH